MKKIISLVLAVLMLGAICAPVFAADYAEYSDIPVIYCQGQGAKIVSADNSETVYPVNTPENYIMDAVEDCLPDLINAIKDDTQENWDIYRDKLLSYVEPLYTDLRLDGDGNIPNGSHVDFSWSAGGLSWFLYRAGGNYSAKTFSYQMDWRLSPFEVAEDLHNYIQTIKSITGAEKVNAVFRCEATSNMAAYFLMYGYEDFNCIDLYISSLDGIETVSALFSGNLSFDAESAMRFLDSYEENVKAGIENDALTEFLYSTLYMLKETYTLDGALKLLTPVIKKIYQNAIAPAILASYGTFPGIWSSVCADEYEDAKKWVFNGVEEEYAGLIEKLDYYHENIGLKTEEILKDAQKAGIKFAVFAKYGEYQTYPIADTNNDISDDTTTLKASSFGATTAKYSTCLSDSYIANAEKNGTAKYISADKKVDASTCIFPDTTWIIFNNHHKEFPDSIDRLMMNFFVTDGELTVFSDADYPQYLYCSDAASGCVLSPLTAENGFQTVENPSTVNEIKVSIKDKVAAFVNSLIAIIRNFLVKLFRGEADLSFLDALN